MKKLKGFTLVEILIVLFVISLLATLVAVSVISVLKRSRDDRRATDVNSIASALDQYANEHKRKYPVLINSGTCTASLPSSAYCAIEVTSSNAALTTFLGKYLSPLPQDPKKQAGSIEYTYVYIYRRDGLKATVVAEKFERGTAECNVPSSASLRPESLSKYMAGTFSGPADLVKPHTPCYYVAR